MTAKLTLTHGLPGSGKSTWAEAEVAKDPANRVRVNRDDIRTELFGEKYHKGDFPQKSESQVTQVHQRRVREGLAAGKQVYCDDTNLNPRFMGQLAQLASNYGAEFEQKYFDVPVAECKRRNALRAAAGGRDVPEFVIDRMAHGQGGKGGAYDDEGHIKEFVVSSNFQAFAVPRSTPGMRLLADLNKRLEVKYPFKGKAIVLVDVDGTLAVNHHEANRAFGRPGQKKDFPYFFRSIEQAKVNAAVRDLANTMRDKDNLSIVVLTGREDGYAKELIAFIERSGLKVSRVIAKRAGDFRPDSDFKREQLANLRAEGLIPVHSIDDRERSVRIYEEDGIMVSRVKEHHPEDPATAPKEYPDPEVSTIYGSGACIRCGQPLKTGNIGPKCATKP